jgi:uncharacterized membrane protein HdeD (DUF308 family)
MLFAETLTGIILIISGVLVKINPNLIAGYNTLSESDKQKIDIKRLSTFIHNGLILIGAVSIISSITMYFLNVKESYRLMIIVGLIVLGVLYIAINSTKMKK